jgi:hypothetical protein
MTVGVSQVASSKSGEDFETFQCHSVGPVVSGVIKMRTQKTVFLESQSEILNGRE